MKQWILASSLLISQFMQAQTPVDKMDQLVAAYASQHRFNGSVMVVKGDQILFARGYGWQDGRKKIPMDTATIFQIGSVTKQFTAAVILQLQEEKKLSVQDHLDKYFKGFANGDKITIAQLLSHTSGIYNYTNDSSIMESHVTRSYSQKEMLDLFRKYPSDFAPGTNWNYSNTGYSLLGYIIEKVEKKPYERVVRERILQPLGMTHSGFDFTHLKDARKAQGYYLLAGDQVVEAPIVDSTIAYSAGALYSTVGDLRKWERAIARNQILSAASWQSAFTPVMKKYGYGWFIDSIYGTPLIGHSGGIHGFASYLMRFPSKDMAIYILDNASSRELQNICLGLAAIAMNQPYKMPEAKKEIAMDASVLKDYEGEYELAPGFTITVRADGSQLKAQATNQSEFDLFAEKKDVFFLKVVEAKVEFVRDTNGKVTEMILYQNGMSPHGKKIR